MSASPTVTLPKLKLSPKKVISPQIYNFLRKHITEMTIKPGTLLSENLLSEHFNVSRQPVREALMRLSYEGLLSVMPQRGSIVEKISIADIEQTVFVRLAIEKECVLMFPKLSQEAQEFHLAQLAENLEQQRNVFVNADEDADIKSVYLRLDDAFHEKLCAISKGPVAWATIQSLQGQIDRIRYLTFDNINPPDVVTSEHEQIYEYLKNHRLDECISILTKHLVRINYTHKEIAKEYEEWFTSESNH